MKRLHALLLIAALAGCTHRPTENIPPVQWRDHREALDILARRAEAVRTMTAQGLITLVRPDGESVRFDLVMVRDAERGVRLRAWKLGRAVFDLTMTRDGSVWLLTPDDPALKQKVRDAGVSARKVVETWDTLNGSLFRARDGQLTEDRDGLIYRRGEIVCRVDRQTLVPRRYELRDDRDRVRFTLDLSDYREIAGQPFPHRYGATSDDGKVLIALRDVELNSELAPNALAPPKRAEKLP